MKTIKDIEKAAIDLYENLEMNSILINRRKIDAIIKGVRAQKNAVAYLCDRKKM